MSTWSSKQSWSCPRPLPIAAAAEDIVPAQLCTALTGDSVYLAFSPKLTLLRSQFWKFWTLILGYICFFAPNFGHGRVVRVVRAAPHSPINLPELKSNCCKNQKPPETEFDIQMVEDYRKYLLKICTYAILAQPWLIAHFRNTNKPKNCVTQIFGNGKND